MPNVPALMCIFIEPVIWDINPKLAYSSGLTAGSGSAPVILTIVSGQLPAA
jgi:hypothetical protein